MANANEIFTRIQLKYDTLDNWLDLTVPGQGGNLILGEGEVGFCAVPSGDATATTAPTVLFKVGDGKLPFHHTDSTKCLKWASALAADVHAWAKEANKPTYSAEEITGISKYISDYVSSEMGIEVDTDTQYQLVKDGNNYKLQSKGKGDTAWADVANSVITMPEATKVEKSTQNGYIKVDGVEVKVYELPTLTTKDISDFGDYKTKQTAYTADGSTAKTITKVEQNANGEVTVTYGDIAFPDATVVEDSEQNGYIKVDGEDVQVFDEIFHSDGQKTVVACGGIGQNSQVDGKTIQQILYNMMFPYQKPTISVSASPKNGGTFEKGNNQTITSVTAIVTKKTEEIAKVELYNGSTLVATKNGTDTLSSTNSNLVKNGGAVVFEGLSREVSSNGGQYKAKVYDTTGGTAEASTGSFTFVYPYYIGICYEGDTIDEALVLGLPSSGENGDTGSKKIQGEADVKDYEFSYTKGSMVFAFPKSYGKLSSIKDPSNFEISGSFTIHEVNITGLDGTAQPYYVYVSGVATNKDFKVDFFK